MNKLHLKIVTPEKVTFDEEVDQVVLETDKGQMGILPNHINLMAKVVPGELIIKNGGKSTVLATGSGLVQIANNVVSILTDLAEKSEDISEKEVEAARERAQKALAEKLTDEEYADTLAILEKSLAQLKVKRRHQVR